MFDKLKKAASKLQEVKLIADAVSKPHFIPIPQKALNLTLPYFYKDIPELHSIQISIHDGYFLAAIRAKKWIEVETTLRFEITETRLTAEEQYISLRQMEKANLYSEGFIGKIALIIVESLFFSIIKTDPAQYIAKKQAGITVQDDMYHINLGLLGLKDWLVENPRKEALLRFGAISEIRCIEGMFKVKSSLNLS